MTTTVRPPDGSSSLAEQACAWARTGGDVSDGATYLHGLVGGNRWFLTAARWQCQQRLQQCPEDPDALGAVVLLTFALRRAS